MAAAAAVESTRRRIANITGLHRRHWELGAGQRRVEFWKSEIFWPQRIGNPSGPSCSVTAETCQVDSTATLCRDIISISVITRYLIIWYKISYIFDLILLPNKILDCDILDAATLIAVSQEAVVISYTRIRQASKNLFFEKKREKKVVSVP